MNMRRFDAITRELAAQGSRRQALKAVVAGAVGGALGLVAPHRAEAAKCGDFEKRCGSAGCYFTPFCGCCRGGGKPFVVCFSSCPP
jgi:hypothetical protein